MNRFLNIHTLIVGFICGMASQAGLADDARTTLDFKGHQPVPLNAKNAPTFLKDALVFKRDKPPRSGDITAGLIEFTVKSDGPVFLAASWTRDGSQRGGWVKELLKHSDLYDKGWLEISWCPWLPEHILYHRECKAGETFKIRTRKYNPPQVMVAGPVDFLDPKLRDTIPVRSLTRLLKRRYLKLLADKKYDDLDAIAKRLREKKEKFRNGDSRLLEFYDGLGDADTEARTKVTDKEWKARLAQLEAWAKANPKSRTAQMVLATCYGGYASFARGTDWAYKVPEDAFRLYGERKKKARQILLQIEKDFPKNDPAVYASLIGGASEHDDDRKTLDGWLRQSVAIDPTYQPTFRAMAIHLMPRWSGAPGELEKFADEAVELTKHACGSMMYATIVQKMSWYEMNKTFDSFAFSWEKTRKGFRDFEKTYPKSRDHLDRFLYLAGISGDRKTAHGIIQRIGDNYRISHWGIRNRYNNWRNALRPEAVQGDHKLLMQAHSDGVDDIAYSNDGKVIASSGFDSRICLWDTTSGKRLVAMRLPSSWATCLDFSPKANILAAGTGDGNVMLLDFANRRRGMLEGHKSRISDVCFSPSGKLLATVSYDQQLIIWNVATGDVHKKIEKAYRYSLRDVSFSSDDKLAAIVGRGGRVIIRDTTTGESKANWMVQNRKIVGAVVFLPGDERIATGDATGAVQIWDIKTQKVVASTKPMKIEVQDLSISPDGKSLAIAYGVHSGARPGGAFVWNMSTKSKPIPLKGLSLGVNAIRFSPSGKTIATGAYEWCVRTWGVEAK